ncbi:DUF2892 domain-containing protein [Acidobacteriota bacterium]
MKKNVGQGDRIIRLSLAVIVVILFFTKQITGTAALILGIFAVMWILTGLIRFCPLYVPFKISTKKKK